MTVADGAGTISTPPASEADPAAVSAWRGRAPRAQSGETRASECRSIPRPRAPVAALLGTPSSRLADW